MEIQRAWRRSHKQTVIEQYKRVFAQISCKMRNQRNGEELSAVACSQSSRSEQV